MIVFDALGTKYQGHKKIIIIINYLRIVTHNACLFPDTKCTVQTSKINLIMQSLKLLWPSITVGISVPKITRKSTKFANCFRHVCLRIPRQMLVKFIGLLYQKWFKFATFRCIKKALVGMNGVWLSAQFFEVP